MKKTIVGALMLGFLCVFVLLTPAPARSQDEDAKKLWKGFIGSRMQKIVWFGHPECDLVERDYVGSDSLKNGFKLTYTYEVRNILQRGASIAFFFDKDGKFEFLDITKSNTGRKPFDFVGNDLDTLRKFMRSHPKVEDDPAKLKEVIKSSAKELCEMWIKLEQELFIEELKRKKQ